MKTYKEFINENIKENPVSEYLDPVIVYWDKEKTKIKSEEWFNSKGEYSRVDGPAFQWWYENGQKHYEVWYLDGKYHRLDDPAYVGWYLNGQKDREVWYLDGKRHSVDGPAYQSYENGQKDSEYWYLDGIEYTKLDWEEKLKEDYPEDFKNYIMKLDFDNMGI